MNSPPVLDAAEVARAERLSIALRRPVAGSDSGAHRARSRGRSLDFADWREYQPGDDPRAIDPQAWARLDQVLVRLYEADVDLSVTIVVDTSGSMGFGRKFRQAQRCAAAIAVSGLSRNEVVGVQRLVDPMARRWRGRGSIGPLLSQIGGWTAEGVTPLEDAVARFARSGTRRGLVVVVSDFLTDGWERSLDRLAARGDSLLTVAMTSAADDHPDLAGELQLVDVETGATVDVDATPELVARVAQRRRERRSALRQRTTRNGGRYVEIADDESVFGVALPRLLATEMFR